MTQSQNTFLFLLFFAQKSNFSSYNTSPPLFIVYLYRKDKLMCPQKNITAHGGEYHISIFTHMRKRFRRLAIEDLGLIGYSSK